MTGRRSVIASTVRRARSEDAPAITGLVRAAYSPYVARIAVDPAPMTADYAKVLHDGEAWVAEQTRRLVALLVLQTQPDRLLLKNVAVAPDSQKVGIGRILLDLADRRSRELGFAEVRLYTNVAMGEILAYYPATDNKRRTELPRTGFQRFFFTKRLHGA